MGSGVGWVSNGGGGLGIMLMVVICVVVFGYFGFLVVVVGGCSWLASCCWVVVFGWQWLLLGGCGRLFLVGRVGGLVCGVFIIVR